MVTPHFPPKVTGMSVAVFEISRKLSKIGCEIHLVAPLDPKTFRFKSKFLLHSIAYHGLAELKSFLSDGYFDQIIQSNRPTTPFYIASIPKVKEIVENLGVNVVHIHSSYDDYVAGYLGVKVKEAFPKITTILTIHGGGKEPNEKESSIRKMILNRLDKVITVSNSLKLELLTCGVLPEKVVVIPNGVGFQRFKVSRSDLVISRRRHCIGENEPVVLYAGRLDPGKGVTYLLSAFMKVLKVLPNAKLVLAGDGYLKSVIMEIVVKLHLQTSVIIKGLLSYKDMPQLYAVADVIALPSTRKEACPMTLLEAMANRKPLVATSVRGTTEIITNNETGLLVSPRDALQLAEALVKLLTDRKLALTLAENGYKHVKKHFNINAVIEQLVKVYQNTQGYTT